ncbi:hypothetical protein ACFL45_11730, partial [Candidatus Neomarinimicrobiota bacterium]
MPETTNIEFDYKEVAEALVRYNNIHEGLWGISIKFGLQGANIGMGEGSDVTPAAIVPILRLGLRRFDEPNNLTVDASKINPV